MNNLQMKYRDLTIGYQDSNPENGHQGDMPYWLDVCHIDALMQGCGTTVLH